MPAGNSLLFLAKNARNFQTSQNKMVPKVFTDICYVEHSESLYLFEEAVLHLKHTASIISS